MKSICIKTNNQKTIDYLLEKLNNSDFNDIYFSYRKFKNYDNIIIHFIGKNTNLFLKEVSKILSYMVMDLFEEDIIEKLIASEYFYFDSIERQEIFNYTIEDLFDNDESMYTREEIFQVLYEVFYAHFKNHHSIYLKGFITFRMKKYFEILCDQIDKSVNEFLVQREYTEFITLLKMYINSEVPACNIVHLVYFNSKPILLDENKNAIKIDEDMFNAKYLSDITFSSNDYALNTLLNLVPRKIYIHLIDNTIDEFITTLKLIFEDRVIYCRDCAICKMYKKSHALIWTNLINLAGFLNFFYAIAHKLRQYLSQVLYELLQQFRGHLNNL